MVICGACEHPGVHAAVLPPVAGMPDRCEDCPRCNRPAAAPRVADPTDNE
jgi:hypothetical protein